MKSYVQLTNSTKKKTDKCISRLLSKDSILHRKEFRGVHCISSLWTRLVSLSPSDWWWPMIIYSLSFMTKYDWQPLSVSQQSPYSVMKDWLHIIIFRWKKQGTGVLVQRMQPGIELSDYVPRALASPESHTADFFTMASSCMGCEALWQRKK